MKKKDQIAGARKFLLMPRKRDIKKQGSRLYHCLRCFEVFRCKMQKHRHVKNDLNCTEKKQIRLASPEVPTHLRCLVSQNKWELTIFQDLRVGMHFQTFLVDAVVLRSKEFRRPDHRKFIDKFFEFEFRLKDQKGDLSNSIGQTQEASLHIKTLLKDWIFLLFLKTISPESESLEEAYEYVNRVCLRETDHIIRQHLKVF